LTFWGIPFHGLVTKVSHSARQDPFYKYSINPGSIGRPDESVERCAPMVDDLEAATTVLPIAGPWDALQA